MATAVPSWATYKQLRIAADLIRSDGKLTAVKALKDMTKCGLREAKDVLDNIEMYGLGTPVDKLREHLDEIQRLIDSTPEVIREAFPHLSNENMDKAVSNRVFLEELMRNGEASHKFSI